MVAMEINQKENDMKLLIDGYQVQIVSPLNSTINKATSIIEELQKDKDLLMEHREIVLFSLFTITYSLYSLIGKL